MPSPFLKGRSKMFKKEINPYSVSDKVTFRNVDRTLTLFVRDDAAALVSRLTKAQERLSQITQEANDEERYNAARFFAQAIFGPEQGDQLFGFYGEPLAVINVCGIYFKQRLGKKITKAQKK